MWWEWTYLLQKTKMKSGYFWILILNKISFWFDFIKWILHDWSDEKCVKILRNCKKAVPDSGRVIVIETIIPREVSDTDIATKNALHLDMIMMCLTRGGRERTKEEFEVLAMKAGFKLPNFIYGAYSFWVIELYTNWITTFTYTCYT